MSLCSKCNKEEKETIGRCWNCNEFIYKGGLIYESSRSESGGFSFWLGFNKSKSEKIAQCDKCYQNWRNKLKKKKDWWKKGRKELMLTFFIVVLLLLVFYLFFPDKFDQVDKQLGKLADKIFGNSHWIVKIIFLISAIFIFAFFFFIVSKEPEVNRYEILKEKEDPKKKKKIPWWRKWLKIIFRR